MPEGDFAEPLIRRLARRVKHDPDIHHDIDEQRILADERLDVSTLLLEPGGERLSCLNEHLIQRGILGQPVPAVVRGEEYKAQVVNLGIELPGLQRLRVTLGLLAPVAGVLRARLGAAVENPHHPRQKAVAPVCPRGTLVFPLSVLRIHRAEAGILLDQFAHLLLRHLKGVVEYRSRVVAEMNHFFSIFSVRKVTRVPRGK